MKRLIFITAWILVATAVILGLSYEQVLKSLGNRLLYETQTPAPSKLGIVLGGGLGERVEKAAELYHQGLVEKFVFTGGKLYVDHSSSHLMKDYAIKLGIPSENILIEAFARSTRENAVLSQPFVVQENPEILTIITADFHSYRSHLVFKKVFSQTPLQSVSGKTSTFDEDWWKDHEKQEDVATEYIKLLGYLVKGYL